ncbi:MAG: glycosyltransferase family 2 protein, partial [Oscillospiraceae bacterium]|nr:glycosyltransferase family 2 protein [Oscillospiraceae bacterium]
SFYHLATRIQGTGFLFAAELIENGWNYTSLTEDRAFCADAVANGYRISYNNDAEFYDEQPVDIKIAMRQRIRWAKGHLQAFVETGPKLFSHIFVTHGMANCDGLADAPCWKRCFHNVRLRFMSFDMLTVVYPRALLTCFKRLIVLTLNTVSVYGTGYAFVKASMGPDWLQWIFRTLHLAWIAPSRERAVLMLWVFLLSWTLNGCLRNMLYAAYVFIFEHKRIVPIKWYRKLWYILTFPMFDLIGKLALVIALLIPVDWKPIPHHANVSIDELEQNHNPEHFRKRSC